MSPETFRGQSSQSWRSGGVALWRKGAGAEVRLLLLKQRACRENQAGSRRYEKSTGSKPARARHCPTGDTADVFLSHLSLF